MKYLVLLAGTDSDDWDNASADEIEAEMAQHIAFAEAVRQRATLLGGEALAAPGDAITLRPAPEAGGARPVTEGPYAESAEQIGGYYVIESDDRQVVVELCDLLPRQYTLEIRPIVDMG